MTDQRYMKPGVEFARNKLVEECGELLAALGKTGRWGWNSYNPEVPIWQREINKNWVMRELDDVLHACHHLVHEIELHGVDS